MGKIAAIFGATGLVGGKLLNRLVDDDNYIKILVFNRKLQNYSENKIDELQVDWSNIPLLEKQLIADDLFCCVGTTIKKAGSKEAFRKVDFEIPANLARIAEQNKIKKFIVISSIGADAKSKNFYLQTKGQMEQEVLKYAINKTHFVRPSMILGKRAEFRFGEETGKIFMRLFNPLMIGALKHYKAIPADTIASAMLELAKNDYDKTGYNSGELWELAKCYDQKS